MSTCACGHDWNRHKRTANGAHACAHWGCGCRDVVPPRELPRWQVIAVKRHKSGDLKSILAYDWLKPMTETQARKMAWACDVWGDREIRVREIGDESIGVPHAWLTHAPPAFFVAP